MCRRSKWALLFVLTLGGCTKTATNDEYVARVGDAVLTRHDLAKAGVDSAHQVRQFISQWVDTQVLYQEAQRKGFAGSEEVLQGVEEAKRQLSISAFLESEIYSGGMTVSNESARDEFNSNRDAYRLREDVVQLSYALFDDRDAANTFRVRILRGATWDEALKSVQADEELRGSLIRSASKEYFTQPMLYPEELWKIARALSREDVSYVVRTPAGYLVALVHDLKRQGELPDFDYAKSEIQERLLTRVRRAKYETLLAALRGKYTINVRLPETDSIMTSEEK